MSRRSPDLEQRLLELAAKLDAHVDELADVLSRMRQGSSLVTVCMHCRALKEDDETWAGVSERFAEYAGVKVSHGLCMACYVRHYE